MNFFVKISKTKNQIIPVSKERKKNVHGIDYCLLTTTKKIIMQNSKDSSASKYSYNLI